MSSWKRSVNDWQTRLTGYELVRARRAGGSPDASKREFPADYDESYREIIRACAALHDDEQRQAARLDHGHPLHPAASPSPAPSSNVASGAVAACTPSPGRWTSWVTTPATSISSTPLKACPPPTDKDVRIDGRDRRGPARNRAQQDDAAVGRRHARRRSAADSPTSRTTPGTDPLRPGPGGGDRPRQAPERIALLRLDTDWYESTRHEFEHLYPACLPAGCC